VTLFSIGKKWKGQIGIALHDGAVTIGQCGWKHGVYIQPHVTRIEKNPRELTAEDWRKALGSQFMGSECSIALPASIAHHQVLRLPNMTESELKEAAAWEMADRLGIDRSKLQMDAMQIGTGGDVLAVAIEQATLSELLEPIYGTGLQPTSIESQSASIARTMSMLHRRQSDQANVRSVLDFGMNDSSFMVLAGDSIMFYKHLEYSGKSLIESIASHTGVSIEQATRMLVESATLDPHSDIGKTVRDATRAIHEAIATDAMKCIRHYGVTNRGPLSSQLIITGSAGWNVFLAGVLSTACNQEVVKDASATHIQALPNEVINTPGWHIALGASLSIFQETQQRRGSDRHSEEAA
jgi:Tfp pilus assembly PilM family ATPase